MQFSIDTCTVHCAMSHRFWLFINVNIQFCFKYQGTSTNTLCRVVCVTFRISRLFKSWNGETDHLILINNCCLDFIVDWSSAETGSLKNVSIFVLSVAATYNIGVWILMPPFQHLYQTSGTYRAPFLLLHLLKSIIHHIRIYLQHPSLLLRQKMWRNYREGIA